MHLHPLQQPWRPASVSQASTRAVSIRAVLAARGVAMPGKLHQQRVWRLASCVGRHCGALTNFQPRSVGAGTLGMRQAAALLLARAPSSAWPAAAAAAAGGPAFCPLAP